MQEESAPLVSNKEGSFSRVYMTPKDDNPEAKQSTPEKVLEEGRVKTEEEHFQEKYKITQEDVPEEKVLAGKYKSTEELEKAYLELQSKLGQESPKEETREVKEEVTEAPTQDLFLKGYEEWKQEGNISEATKKSFIEKGIPEQYIDQYIEGANAQIELMTMKIHNALGGQDHVNELISWATDNLSDAEIATYNDLIETGDLDKITTAYQSIEARMSQKTATKKFIQPDSGTSNDRVGFASKAEMIEAMNNPKYKKDSAYRAEVERKLANSRNI